MCFFCIVWLVLTIFLNVLQCNILWCFSGNVAAKPTAAATPTTTEFTWRTHGHLSASADVTRARQSDVIDARHPADVRCATRRGAAAREPGRTSHQNLSLKSHKDPVTQALLSNCDGCHDDDVTAQQQQQQQQQPQQASKRDSNGVAKLPTNVKPEKILQDKVASKPNISTASSQNVAPAFRNPEHSGTSAASPRKKPRPSPLVIPEAASTSSQSGSASAQFRFASRLRSPRIWNPIDPLPSPVHAPSPCWAPRDVARGCFALSSRNFPRSSRTQRHLQQLQQRLESSSAPVTKNEPPKLVATSEHAAKKEHASKPVKEEVKPQIENKLKIEVTIMINYLYKCVVYLWIFWVDFLIFVVFYRRSLK